MNLGPFGSSGTVPYGPAVRSLAGASVYVTACPDHLASAIPRFVRNECQKRCVLGVRGFYRE